MDIDFKSYSEYAPFRMNSLPKDNSQRVSRDTSIIPIKTEVTSLDSFFETLYFMSSETIIHFKHLVGFLKLIDDWDGYGASKFSQNTILNSIDVLLTCSRSVYRISPSPNDSVLFVWKQNHNKLLVEISSAIFNYAIVNSVERTGSEYRNLPFNKDTILEIIETFYAGL